MVNIEYEVIVCSAFVCCCDDSGMADLEVGAGQCLLCIYVTYLLTQRFKDKYLLSIFPLRICYEKHIVSTRIELTKLVAL